MELLLHPLPSGPGSGDAGNQDMISHWKSQDGRALGREATVPPGATASSTQLPRSFEESPNSQHSKGWERDLISLLMFNFLFLIMFKLVPKCQVYS